MQMIGYVATRDVTYYGFCCTFLVLCLTLARGVTDAISYKIVGIKHYYTSNKGKSLFTSVLYLCGR